MRGLRRGGVALDDLITVAFADVGDINGDQE
jgi:hypothetical protein